VSKTEAPDELQKLSRAPALLWGLSSPMTWLITFGGVNWSAFSARS
jgi:hypothetical protein